MDLLLDIRYKSNDTPPEGLLQEEWNQIIGYTHRPKRFMDETIELNKDEYFDNED